MNWKKIIILALMEFCLFLIIVVMAVGLNSIGMMYKVAHINIFGVWDVVLTSGATGSIITIMILKILKIVWKRDLI